MDTLHKSHDRDITLLGILLQLAFNARIFVFGIGVWCWLFRGSVRSANHAGNLCEGHESFLLRGAVFPLYLPMGKGGHYGGDGLQRKHYWVLSRTRSLDYMDFYRPLNRKSREC